MEYRNDDARVLQIHESNYLREVEGEWKVTDRDIAKKPYQLFRGTNKDGTPMQNVIGYCPACNKYMGYSAYDYCQNCGQLFDWSDAYLCVATPRTEVDDA